MIKTGKFPVTLYTAAAILSLSLVVNLPGLAISPMLGTLSEIFPKTTQIEKQLLTVLPNLLIIPFVLLSGKLSMTRHKIAVVVAGLLIYAGAGVSYLFCSSMTALIVVSCLIGVGAGLIIPFSTGFIADVYAGAARMKQMGLQSGISNLTLVACTFVVGWLGHGNWHLPFLVYLLPLLPLAMIFGLRGIPRKDLVSIDADAPEGAADRTPANIPEGEPHTPLVAGKVVNGFYIKRILSVIGVYFLLCYCGIVISYYCPFLVEKKDWSDELTGTITSLFFLFIFLPGFLLLWIVRIFRRNTFVISVMVMTVGLAIFAFLQTPWAMCVGAVLIGFGYGVCQPLIYDKASRTVSNPSKSTLALAFVLTSNYLAVVLAPFIVDLLRELFHAGGVSGFAFRLNFWICLAFLILAIIKRRSFCFGVPSEYWKGQS